MDFNDVMIDILEACQQLYFIIARKPFLTVSKVDCETDGKAGDAVSFAIENEGCHDLEVRKIWFLTSFNRQVYAGFFEPRLPVKVPENGREVFSVPVGELKQSLNRSVGETVTRVVALDSNGRQSTGRFRPEARARLGK